MTEHLIVAINGAAGCGKSTFVRFCKEYADTLSNVEVREISIVDWVKERAKELGWDGKSKTSADRDFLAGLKDLTDHYNGAPFESITKFLEKAYRPFVPYQIVFVHLRQNRDIERLRKWVDNSKWSFQVAYVERHGVKPVVTNEADRDVIDTMDIADMVIRNDGNLGDLKQAAVDFVDDVANNRVTAMFYGVEAETGDAQEPICMFILEGWLELASEIALDLTESEAEGLSKFLNVLQQNGAKGNFTVRRIDIA